MTFSQVLRRTVGPQDAGDQIARLLENNECRTALDLVCGFHSPLQRFRPGLRTFGIDAAPSAVAAARAAGVHDQVFEADVLRTSPEDIRRMAGVDQFDLVTLFDVIEHVPKRLGFELLERCEQLTAKFVVVLTPNGFVPQGPEFGNVYQRHLSGWYPNDFRGLGYQVSGISGLACFHGYAGSYRPSLPGIKYLDITLFKILMAKRFPSIAFGLIATKDVRGVPARLGARPPNP